MINDKLKIGEPLGWFILALLAILLIIATSCSTFKLPHKSFVEIYEVDSCGNIVEYKLL